MQREPVGSSNLKSVGYDAGTKVLEIEFRSGDIYQYYNVPPDISRGLLNAGSKGTYHHQYIRQFYTFKKLA
jgi:hypothetical protein